MDLYYDPVYFDGLKTHFSLFVTTLGQNATMFDNWNFKNANTFDDFWFDEKENFMIYQSEEHIIGRESIESAKLRVSPELTTKKGYVAKMYILGVAVQWKDEVTQNLVYDRNLNENVDMRTPKTAHFNDTNVNIMFTFDWNQREYILHYFGMEDIITSVGGMLAFLTPLINFLSPYFIIYFLF